MKKPTDASQIIVKGVLYNGEKAEPYGVRQTSSNPALARTSLSPDERSVAEAACVADAIWGELAATAIAWYALSAHCAGDTAEYCFWFKVFATLQKGPSDSEPEG